MSYSVLSDGQKLLYINVEESEVSIPNDETVVIESNPLSVFNKVTVTRSSDTQEYSKRIIKCFRRPIKIATNKITITPDNLETINIKGGPYSEIVLNPTTRVDIVTNQTEIAYEAFKSTNITSYTNNYTNSFDIGSKAFYNCSSLEKIITPNARYINENVFYGCSNLVNIDFSNAETLGNYCFDSCSNLETLRLPVGRVIGNGCFSKCHKLNDLYLGYSSAICSIGNYAFEQWRSGHTLTVHVRSTLLNSYRSDTSWAAYESAGYVTFVGDYHD